MKKSTVNIFFVGVKLSSIYPLLEQVATQQGLSLCRVREFNIAKQVLVNSIINN